jgi:hypothetical protein
MLNELRQYTGYKSGIPNLNIVFGYAAADLMIDGLKIAGSNPTRSAFISNLRKVTSWDGEGFFASPVSFAGFATTAMFPATSCTDYFKITMQGYQPYPKNPVCGSLVAVHK